MSGKPFVHSDEPGKLVIQFADNELNLFNIDEVAKSYGILLGSLKNRSGDICFDLANVRSIDSSAAAFLVRSHLSAKKTGSKLRLINISDNIRRTLEYANLLNDFVLIES